MLTPKQDERFWQRVAFTEQCWLWVGYVNPKGYGQYADMKAHRVAYAIVRGSIPDGMTIDHLCRNRRCVNPSHLEPVPTSVNVTRGGNSIKTHCHRGHEFTPENTRKVNGRWRQCRTCQREWDSADQKTERRRLSRRESARRRAASGRCGTCGKAATAYRCESCNAQKREKHHGAR